MKLIPTRSVLPLWIAVIIFEVVFLSTLSVSNYVGFVLDFSSSQFISGIKELPTIKKSMESTLSNIFLGPKLWAGYCAIHENIQLAKTNKCTTLLWIYIPTLSTHPQY